MARRPRKTPPGPGRGAAPVVEKPAGPTAPGADDAPASPVLPAPGSVVGETEFTSPKGFRYRIIHTRDVDPGDPEIPPPGGEKA